jgi:hypothetical protein
VLPSKAKARNVWHLLAYDEFFPDVESAEAALARTPHARAQSTHGANESRLRTHADARTRQPSRHDDELVAYNDWLNSEREVSDRSAY